MRSNKGNDVGMTIPNQLGQDQHHPVALFAHLPFYAKTCLVWESFNLGWDISPFIFTYIYTLICIYIYVYIHMYSNIYI